MKTAPFNAEQAKAGRPVLESGYKIDVIAYCGKHVWCNRPESTSGPLTYYAEELYHPADPASGHNPAQLDEWQVGVHEGQRTLAREEALCRRAEFCDGLEVWNASAKEWFPAVCGINEHYTYRTRRPPGFFLPKVVTRNLRRDELPEKFIFRDSVGCVWIEYRNQLKSCWIDEQPGTCSAWSRSLDGPWKPFTVEEKL